MWGRRKDTNQPYVKTGKKGVKGSSTSPVADVHLKGNRLAQQEMKEMDKLMQLLIDEKEYRMSEMDEGYRDLYGDDIESDIRAEIREMPYEQAKKFLHAQRDDVHFKQNQMMRVAYKDISGKTHHAKPDSLITQTYLLSKDKFTKKEAIDWLKKEGKLYDLDEDEPNVWRARQISPSLLDEDTYATFTVADGVQISGARLKK